MEDRAAPATGWLATLAAAVARWRAVDPEPPQEIHPPKGLAELGPLLDQVRAAPATPWGAIQRDAQGYSVLPAATCVGGAMGALACLLASEAEDIRKAPQYAWAIGEATINAARDLRGAADRSLDAALLLRIVGKDGRLGPQTGRWASTRQAFTWQHLKMAELLIAKAYEPGILAHGATQWVDQETQCVMHAKFPATNPAVEPLMAHRYASGAKWVGPIVDAVGTVVIDPWRLTLLGPAGVEQAEAMAMLADGRRRWRR